MVQGVRFWCNISAGIGSNIGLTLASRGGSIAAAARPGQLSWRLHCWCVGVVAPPLIVVSGLWLCTSKRRKTRREEEKEKEEESWYGAGERRCRHRNVCRQLCIGRFVTLGGQSGCRSHFWPLFRTKKMLRITEVLTILRIALYDSKHTFG